MYKKNTTEIGILKALISLEEVTRKTIPFMDEDIFDEDYFKIIFNTINNFYSTNNIIPTLYMVKAESLNKPNLSKQTLDDMEEAFKEMEIVEINDERYILEKIEAFIRKRRSENVLMQAIEKFQEMTLEDFITKKADREIVVDGLPKRIEEAFAISLNNSVGMSYLKDVLERYEFYTSPEAIHPSGFQFLDDRTSGGIPRKTLNAFLAPTNVGKTLCLSALALNYAQKGLNVLYVSGEMRKEEILKRIDANSLDFDIRNTRMLKKDDYLNRIQAIQEKTKGDIIVEEYPANTFTINHIRKLYNEIRTKRRLTIDVIIVDYIALLASTMLKKSNSKSYEYQKSVSEELRGLMMELNTIGWTAIQTNRSGSKEGEDTDVDSVADSFGVPMTMDYILSVWRTAEGDMNRVLFAKEIKSRYGNRADCPLIKIGIDFNKQRIFDYDDRTIEKMKMQETMEAQSVQSAIKSAVKFGVHNSYKNPKTKDFSSIV